MHRIWGDLDDKKKQVLFVLLGYVDEGEVERLTWRSWEALSAEDRNRIRAHYLGMPEAFDFNVQRRLYQEQEAA